MKIFNSVMNLVSCHSIVSAVFRVFHVERDIILNAILKPVKEDKEQWLFPFHDLTAINRKVIGAPMVIIFFIFLP